MTVTVDRFLRGVKRKASVPENQQLLEDSDILEMADDEIASDIVPMLISINEDYFVVEDQVTAVADQAEYDIPVRAIGRTLRDLKTTDSGGTVRDLNLIPLEDEHIYTSQVTPGAFYFKGDKIVLIPAFTTTTATVNFWYQIRHSQLVELTDAGKVVNISSNVVTVDNVPSTFTTGAEIDFIQGVSGNNIISLDKTITNVSGSQLTFAAGDVPSSLVEGDYISPAETTPVLQVPDECQHYLELLTMKSIYHAIGDYEAQSMAERRLDTTRANLEKLLSPRIRGEPKKINNPRSLLRGGRYRYRRGLFI